MNNSKVIKSLPYDLWKNLNHAHPSRGNRVIARCLLAKELEEDGNYEAAYGALGELWQGIGARPKIDGLERATSAEVLLRSGVLTGWLGGSRQLEGAQERAKDLISESISIFESLGEQHKIAEGQTELAYCYWRIGSYDEALLLLSEALNLLAVQPHRDHDHNHNISRAVAVIRLGIVLSSANRAHDALTLLEAELSFFNQLEKHSLKGRFHNELAITLKNIGLSERREDYTDRALVEYTAASFHFEQAGHRRYCARVENNLGSLLLRLGRLSEAHDHLGRAIRIFTSLKDTASVAQVSETRAQAFIAEGRYAEAEKSARTAVLTLEKSDQLGLLAEALTTHGVALARLTNLDQSCYALSRAIEVAQLAGDNAGAGKAALTLIEEASDHLTEDELLEAYDKAAELLSGTQSVTERERLHACARRVIRARRQTSASADWHEAQIVGVSEKITRLMKESERIAKSKSAVVIIGETGTGKELLARRIHEWSGRAGKFIAINCAAINETLVESQLFGHLKGSFTDATSDYKGMIREAAGGTLFLDEVAEMALSTQAKLLRFIETGEMIAVGSVETDYVNVRIIAATNRNLQQAVKSKEFREDLYYRLSTIVLDVPPLRERRDDIPLLTQHFIEESVKRNKRLVQFMPEAVEAMRALDLPGNIRELKHLIERTILTSPLDQPITSSMVETAVLRQTANTDIVNAWQGCNLLEEVKGYEAKLIKLALESCEGCITRAAHLLGIKHQTLAFILNGRQKALLSSRKTAQTRRRSIITKALTPMKGYKAV